MPKAQNDWQGFQFDRIIRVLFKIRFQFALSGLLSVLGWNAIAIPATASTSRNVTVSAGTMGPYAGLGLMLLLVVICLIVVRLSFRGLEKKSQRDLSQLSARMVKAQEEERSRIARELHDHINQRLAFLSLGLGHLRRKLADAGPAHHSAINDLCEEASRISKDVHCISHNLHSSTLDHLGAVPAIRRLCAEFSERRGIDVDFESNQIPEMPPDVALCLFRIVQESLNNAWKHGQAEAVRVQLSANRGGIRVEIRDAGRGFNSDKATTHEGLGFISMQERARMFGGTFRVQSTPARGTTVHVWIPLPSQAGSMSSVGESISNVQEGDVHESADGDFSRRSRSGSRGLTKALGA